MSNDSRERIVHTYQTALVLGRGRSGRAAEVLLRREGTMVVSVCEETTPDYNYEDLHCVPDVAVVSPGFSLEHPWVKDLLARGIPLLSEIELGWSRRQCLVIAVTGSNGKSSVVKWIVGLLAEAGLSSVPCGNYGLPLSEAVMCSDAPDWLVVEVSSFQLETVSAFRPDIGVLLNVLPNHLDRHGDMETYRKIKFRLFENMVETDTAIVSQELFPMLGTQPSPKGYGGAQRFAAPKSVTFGLSEDADFFFQQGRVGAIDLRGTYFDNEVLGSAAAAVAAVAQACGIDARAVERSARRFEPLPHRMEKIAELDGVSYVDDSKATNLAGMCAAVKMCKGQVHLIAGGRPKETDFSFAKDLLAQHVSRLYLIGEASVAMQTAWGEDIPCVLCGTLEEAVDAARSAAEQGDTVLLSPACTSFDQFRSFSERGECFENAVRRGTDGAKV
jgi:UDP-N-acetylmuramoylalanine--D-glutamate ligase